MTYAFLVFYRYKLMEEKEAQEAKEFWVKFSKESWPKEITIVGDYRYAWGTEWSGFLVVETESPQLFFEFWPLFRDKTRWYIENTRTVIGMKRHPTQWMESQ
ncbi:MAG: hypothetical protein BAJATHORv1_30168 [Candidatus Thorarchaeota archaeon]|nr:MAG: hypothetical protein BAJATHORv1_30168 [Candidatus Thorarchaeota archaeon]